MLGIIGVFLCTGIMLLVRNVLLAARRDKRKPVFTSSVQASKSNLRLVGSESNRAQVKTVMNP
jgi:hypothetical protein